MAQTKKQEEEIEHIPKEDHNLFEEILLPQYRGHELHFWENLQLWHDTDEHWIDNKLTSLGEKYMTDLVIKYT